MTQHVLTDPRTGRLSFRRVYPADLRQHIPGRPTELKRSLRARSLADPAAMRIYAEAQAEYERNLATARLKATGSSRPIADADIPFLVATYVHRLRKNLRDTHWDDTDARREWLTVSAWRYAPFGFMDGVGAELAGRAAPWTNSQRLREALPALIRHWRRLQADGVRSALIDAEGQTAEDLCQEYRLSCDPQSPAFFDLCRLLLEADMDAASQLVRVVDPEDATTVLEVPSAPTPAHSSLVNCPSVSAVSAIACATAEPLLDLFDAYVAAQGVSAGVRNEWRNALSGFVVFLGHGDAASITREDVVRWRDYLLTTPSRNGNARKPVTVRDNYLVALRCTLGWAVEEGRLAANAATGVVVRVPPSVKVRDKDYTKAEALAVLKSSLVEPTGRLSAPSVRARRWIPWLCAYSGARVGELAQLRTEDIRQEDGVWVMNITPEAGTVKTKEARLVPLHPHLIEQGFLEMVRQLPSGAIFYNPGNRRAADDGDNRHVKKVGERLARWVREGVGITDTAIKPNHAWRHLFKTLAADAGVPERTADAIQGHAPANVSRRYGRVSVQTKADAMERFPRFDLSA